MDRATELLAAIGRAEWDRVEDSAFELLHSGRFRVPEERDPTIVLGAEARLFGHLDVRGALTLLTPLLVATEPCALGAPWLARATFIANTALRAPCAFALDPDRRLRALLGTRAVPIERADVDLRVRTGLAMAGAGVGVPPGPLVSRHAWLAEPWIEAGCSPVTRCLIAEVRAVLAGLRHDHEERRRAIASGLALAASLTFGASEARLHELASAGP